MQDLAQETADRLREQLAELARDARAVGLETLACQIEMARLEAARQAGDRTV
jgi:hypothetical protein